MTVDLTPFPSSPLAPVEPVSPFLDTEKENFLFMVIPSTVIGIVASQDSAIVDVVLKVIVGDTVLLLVIVAEIPDGQVIVETLTTKH